MNQMQRSDAWSAAADSSAVRPSVVAALLVLVAAGCGNDVATAGDAASREDAGEPDAAANGEPDAGEGAEEPTREMLAHPSLWQEVEASEDPFEDRPMQVSCPETAFGSELLGGELAFSVDSELCDYLTVSQNSRVAIAAGDEVETVFSHFPLTGPDSGVAEAHIAVMLGDMLLAERTIQIPADEKEYTMSWKAPEDVEKGASVYFHVHNHGQNEYSLVSIEVVSDG